MSSDYEFSDNEYYDEDEDAMLEDDGKPTLIPFVCTDYYTHGLSFFATIWTASASEMELDTYNDEYKVKKEKQKSYDTVHQPLTQAEVEKFIQSDVDHITGIFGVDVSTLLYIFVNTTFLCPWNGLDT